MNLFIHSHRSSGMLSLVSCQHGRPEGDESPQVPNSQGRRSCMDPWRENPTYYPTERSNASNSDSSN
jgi:hypothetical protein